MLINKITYITYHNWETKRHGGFHQLAEFTAISGIKTIFFSFSRPYYIAFKRDERLNASILWRLAKGAAFVVGDNIIQNVTWPTFALPGFMRRYFTDKINKWLMTNSLTSFNKFAKKWLTGTDCFVFESCDAVLLLDLIKRSFPNALIVYRPSDPLADFSNDRMMELAEIEMLKKTDVILTVNKESIKLYEELFHNSFDVRKLKLLNNGVHLKDYQKKYDCPDILKGSKSALYVGAFNIDWDLVCYAASKLPEIKFVIITPVTVNDNVLKSIDTYKNIIFIPGIKPSDVPMWVTNASIIIQPYPEKHNFHNKRSMGITAQNYKAMAAQKRIITHMCPASLSSYGIITTYSYDQFCDKILENIDMTNYVYDIDLNKLDWKYLCKIFINIIKAQTNE